MIIYYHIIADDNSDFIFYSPALKKWGYTGFAMSFRYSVPSWFCDCDSVTMILWFLDCKIKTSCQKTTQLAGQSWSDKNTIFNIKD